MIDLHCHSTHSDGLYDTKELYHFAIQNGVKILALTDHDTVSGVAELQSHAVGSDLTIITGIEISTRWRKHDIHVVGLDLDINHPVLLEAIEEQNQCRIKRAEKIAHSLEALGLKSPLEAAQKVAGHKRLARPHFAQVLIDQGYVKERAQAFTQYLKRGRPAYHPTDWLPIEDAVSVINLCGGTAVLAHPNKYRLTKTKLKQLIEDFVAAKGQSIEVMSGLQSADETKQMVNLCQEYDMLASTGSDFHGGPLTQVRLGGQKPLPDNVRPIWSRWTTF